VQVSKGLGRSFLHGGFAHSVIGEWALAPNLPLRAARSLSATYGFSITPDAALIVQILRSRGPLPLRLGGDLGRASMEIAIGVRHHRPSMGGEITWAIIENLTPLHNTPDVGLFFVYGTRPRGPSGAAAGTTGSNY